MLIVVLIQRERRNRLERVHRAAEIARYMKAPKSPVIENGSQVLVRVEYDGSVRELTDSEKEMVDTAYHPADGGRPYIKSSYDEKNHLGFMTGFLQRKDLPAGITIKPPPVIPQPLDGGRRYW